MTTEKSNEKKNKFLMPAIASLTLGLAPFVPEPHIYKQFLNIANGTFTKPMDWFDLVLHGAPWVWLGVTTILHIKGKSTTKEAIN